METHHCDWSIGTVHLQHRASQVPKGCCWAFRISALETEEIRQWNTLLISQTTPLLRVGLLRVEEQQLQITTATVHYQQYCTDRESVIPIHEMIWELQSYGVVSKTRSPFNSPIWLVHKSSEEWSLTVDYCGLN